MKDMYKVVAALLVVAAVAWPGSARAHAFPSGESPRAGAQLKHAPERVRIHFDSPIEPAFCKLRVMNSSSDNEAASAPEVDSGHRYLSVKLKPLAAGVYSVHWSVVAEDGHRTEGSYSFRVIKTSGRSR